MRERILQLPVELPDDDWFLSQDMTTGATATTFSNDGAAHFTQRVAFSHNHTSAVSITVVYRRPQSPDENFTETISVAASTVAYTTYAVSKLISVTWSSLAKTLKVGFQGYPYLYPGIDMSHGQLIGAVLGNVTYIESGTGGIGITYNVTVGTAGTPAANTIGFDTTSQCIHYCYPENGSSKDLAGTLFVKYKGS
jgi:hypothetical protein